ncbi:MAG: NAD(P)H-hydrate epimerase [Candidatus Peribacteraceae bacterium]|jgi:NAD(P)H-hydrate epimerase|nr:NAD(P)H-hydrate epimerase [Candidatus Peribacteraceae bacterium]HCI04045.1 NAD(P)H-hydrate epimerase [Candidatus Peribacteria bacterium]|tara:strand:- start:1717 stop:2349 length:633 start_codon:yes stop_codon:yes gene_type:complete
MKSYTSAEVAELDRYTIEDLGVNLKQLMEVAGLRSAEAAVKLFGKNKSLTVLVGPGGNGGDALVCAKFLKLWEHDVTVILSETQEKLKPVTSDQLKVWKNFGGEVIDEPPDKTDGIVDGLIGYSLVGDPRGKSAELIDWTNPQNCQVLSLDIPSGLDATTGEIRNPCIKANMTVVFGVMKKGLLVGSAKEYSGDIEIIDIGFPREFPEVK